MSAHWPYLLGVFFHNVNDSRLFVNTVHWLLAIKSVWCVPLARATSSPGRTRESGTVVVAALYLLPTNPTAKVGTANVCRSSYKTRFKLTNLYSRPDHYSTTVATVGMFRAGRRNRKRVENLTVDAIWALVTAPYVWRFKCSVFSKACGMKGFL